MHKKIKKGLGPKDSVFLIFLPFSFWFYHPAGYGIVDMAAVNEATYCRF